MENTLAINVDDGKGCFKLVGAILANSLVFPNNPTEAKNKIKISKKFIKKSKLIQMYCDLAGYDEEVIKSRMLNKLNARTTKIQNS